MAKKVSKPAAPARDAYFMVQLTAEGLKADLDTLAEILTEEKGVRITKSAAIALAVREALAKRKGRR